MLITPDYRAQQRAMHAAPRGYGQKGDKWADVVEGLIGEFRAFWTLDYGAGRGSLGREIQGRGHRIANYDPAVPGWDQRFNERYDLVTCTDVLEHVEAECIDAVLDHIAEVATKAVFLVISTVPAGKILPDGRNAHILLRPRDWWVDQLSSRFVFDRDVACRDHKEIAWVWRAKA